MPYGVLWVAYMHALCGVMLPRHGIVQGAAVYHYTTHDAPLCHTTIHTEPVRHAVLQGAVVRCVLLCDVVVHCGVEMLSIGCVVILLYVAAGAAQCSVACCGET